MEKRYDPISDRVAKNVARLRQERGYTGKVLAERYVEFGRSLEPPIEASITNAIISKIETQYRTVSLTELALFTGALGVTIDTLIDTATEIPGPTLEDRVSALEESMTRILDQGAANRS